MIVDAEFYREMGANVAAARRRLNLSQVHVARYSCLSSPARLRRIETGIAPPTVDELVAIAHVLDIPPLSLFPQG
jgi:transcriptional regulator with XRE-family HTH domain